MSRQAVESPVTGTVWKIELQNGATVKEGDEIMILESMKMEIPVEAPCSGTIVNMKVQPNDSVDEEMVLCEIES